MTKEQVKQPERPVYKKPLFWTTIVFGIIILFLMILVHVIDSENVNIKNALAKHNVYYSAKDKDIYYNVTNSEQNTSSSTTTSPSSDLSSGKAESANKPSTKTKNSLKFGDSGKFSDGSKATVDKVYDASDVELNDVKPGYKKIAIDVTLENTKDSPLRVNFQSFNVYDSKSEIGDFNSRTYYNNIPQSLAAGMKASVTLYYTVKNEGPYTISYGDSLWKE